MTDFFNAFVIFCVFSGLIVFVSSFANPTNISRGLALALDFWTAAGLIRLSNNPAWSSVGIAAGLIVIRKMLTFSLSHAPKLGSMRRRIFSPPN